MGRRSSFESHVCSHRATLCTSHCLLHAFITPDMGWPWGSLPCGWGTDQAFSHPLIPGATSLPLGGCRCLPKFGDKPCPLVALSLARNGSSSPNSQSSKNHEDTNSEMTQLLRGSVLRFCQNQSCFLHQVLELAPFHPTDKFCVSP